MQSGVIRFFSIFTAVAILSTIVTSLNVSAVSMTVTADSWVSCSATLADYDTVSTNDRILCSTCGKYKSIFYMKCRKCGWLSSNTYGTCACVQSPPNPSHNGCWINSTYGYAGSDKTFTVYEVTIQNNSVQNGVQIYGLHSSAVSVATGETKTVWALPNKSGAAVFSWTANQVQGGAKLSISSSSGLTEVTAPNNGIGWSITTGGTITIEDITVVSPKVKQIITLTETYNLTYNANDFNLDAVMS